MHYRRIFHPGGTYFFTLVTYKRKPIFKSKFAVNLLKEAFRYVKVNHPFEIDAFVLLPDHLHCIWTLPVDDIGYSQRLMLIKSYFTRYYALSFSLEKSTKSRLQKRERCVWQRRFWEHLIHDENDFVQHLHYIHYNPVKHGFVLSPKDWQYSSFHQYVKKDLIDIEWGANDYRLDKDIGYE